LSIAEAFGSSATSRHRAACNIGEQVGRLSRYYVMSFMMHCLPIALVRTAKERAPRHENRGAEVREDHENAFNLAISISDAVSLVTQEHWVPVTE
jgi:hypothetical protein